MKRAIAALLALVLALGAVVPTWAEETEEESTAPQATGETYDAGEDTAAPMMMLAAQSAAATAVSTRAAAIKTRVEEYTKACEDFESTTGSIAHWTIDSEETFTKYKTYRNIHSEDENCKDEDCETKILKQKIDQGDFRWALSAKECPKGDAQNHKWTGTHNCRSHYFSGVDDTGNGFSQCQGFANYMGYVLFGEAGTKIQNYEIFYKGIDYDNFDFQPGDIVRVTGNSSAAAKAKANASKTGKDLLAELKQRGHSMMVYKGTGKTATVIECNYGKGTRGYCNVRCDLTVGQKQREFGTVLYVLRPKANLQVTTACPYAPHDPGVTLSDGTYQFKTAQKDGKWTAECKGCGAVYDYMASFNTGDAGVYKVVDATGDGLCSAPYKDASISPLTVGNKVTVIGSVKNAYDNKWMQTADGWIYSGKLKRAENAPTIVNSGYCGGEGDGKNLKWELDSNGTLTIRGRGAMEDNGSGNLAMWRNSSVDVQRLVVGYGVTTIGSAAFYGIESLSSVSLPGSIEVISDEAFHSCLELTNVVIPEGVKMVGSEAFCDCPKIANISLPTSLNAICGRAFMFCDSLTEVLLPEGLLYVGKEAFAGCIGLKTISFPTTFLGIENDAFAHCTRLEKIYFNATCAKDSLGEDDANDSAFAGTGTEDKGISIIVGENVTRIPSCFFRKANIRDINLPNSVTNIGIGAFEGSSLVSITIPASVNFVGATAFCDCIDLTDVYYGGTRAQWNAITIQSWNEPLMSANIHFLATGATVRPGTGAKQEVKAGADGKMAITVPNVVNNKAATVTFDQAAVESISGYGDMTLTVKDNTANLSGTLKNSAEVKGKNAASIIVTLTKADGTPVFTEGTSAGEAVITIPYKTGLVSEKIRVFYVNGEKLTSQAFTYNALTGVVTLKLAHFSEYLIVSESEGAPEPIPTPTPTPTPEPTPTPAPTPNPTPTPGTGTTTPSHGQATASGTAGAKKASAETFDPGVGVYAVTAVLSLTGMAWIRRKRR